MLGILTPPLAVDLKPSLRNRPIIRCKANGVQRYCGMTEDPAEGVTRFVILLVTISLMLNRDLASTRAGASLANWAWIGFLPALAGGYLGAPRIRRKTPVDQIGEVFD